MRIKVADWKAMTTSERLMLIHIAADQNWMGRGFKNG